MTELANRPLAGILFILLGMSAITVNDLLVKLLSEGYALHQIVFIRSFFGIAISLIFLQFEGGWHLIRTDRPFAHAFRGILIVLCNLSFFMAIAAMPIGEATAIFFVAPLFITLLSVPMLGETVGPRRIAAVVIGFAGVIVMMRPGQSMDADGPGLVALLPIAAAATYAMFQLMTRQLRGSASAAAMAVYIQCTFLVVGLSFGLVTGDGRFAGGETNVSWVFLFRAWIVPLWSDVPMFVGLGCVSAVIAYCLSQAYRLAPAATVAPFEYIALPLSVMWGFLIWQDIPDLHAIAGIALILGAGLYVLARERVRRNDPSD